MTQNSLKIFLYQWLPHGYSDLIWRLVSLANGWPISLISSLCGVTNANGRNYPMKCNERISFSYRIHSNQNIFKAMAVSGAHVKQSNRYVNGENIDMLLPQHYSFWVDYYTAIAFYAQSQDFGFVNKIFTGIFLLFSMRLYVHCVTCAFIYCWKPNLHVA